jgi:putative transposase
VSRELGAIQSEKKRYVYVWADGVYCNVRMDDKVCLLVIIGSDELGNKELIAVSHGYRKSEASWSEVLLGLKQRGLNIEPKVAVGDGAVKVKRTLHEIWQSETKMYGSPRCCK